MKNFVILRRVIGKSGAYEWQQFRVVKSRSISEAIKQAFAIQKINGGEYTVRPI